MLKKLLWIFFSLSFVFTTILFVGISLGLFGFMPSFEDLEDPKQSLASEVISVDEKLLGTYFIENRTNTSFKDLSPYLVDALIATEDVRFYKHSGIDLRSLFRVLTKTITLGDKSSGGGSTISQQLAKNLFPRQKLNKFSLALRKLKEWVIAIKLERNYTKEEIMAMYFNTVEFGNNSYGIRSAAQTYFAKMPSELDLNESATLVGMLKATTYYNPVQNPENSFKRKNVVLSQMLKYKYIDQATYDANVELYPDLSNFSRQDHVAGTATYFREHLKKQMQEWCNTHYKSDGSNYNLYKDGLKIYTTIDSRMQKYAEEAVKEWIGENLQKEFYANLKWRFNAPFVDLEAEDVQRIMDAAMKQSDRYRNMIRQGASQEEIRAAFRQKVKMKVFSWQGERDTVMSPLDSLWYHKWFLHCGLMSIEPQTGEVRAYVGGINYKYFQYDNVSQGARQVGSTFKPFVYTLAMQEGEYSPCTKVPNVQVCIPQADDTDWCPKNSGSQKEGEMVSLKWALANSVNYISAYLIKRFPPQSVISLAKKMGITASIDPVPAICLGTVDISVREMVSAMATYANKGIYSSPVFVRRIEDKNGVVLDEFTSTQSEAMDFQTAYLMLDLMKGVVEEGSARRLRFRYGLDMPIAGKTGTTQNHSDGWFIGITPNLASGVWVGGEMRSIHFTSMALGQGANTALPIWSIYMKKVYGDPNIDLYRGDFERPEYLTVDINCSESEDDATESAEVETSEELMM